MIQSVILQDCTESAEPDSVEHFLQTKVWAEFKKMHGWTYRRFEVQPAEAQPFVLTVLLRRLKPFGLLAYIPMGPAYLTGCNSCLPETAEKRGCFLSELAEKLISELPSPVFLLRFDPPWESATENSKSIERLPPVFPLFPITEKRTAYRLLKAASDIQPPDTVRLNLQQPLEALLNDCKPKWRYNIRLAEKKGVRIRCFAGTEAENGISLFYKLYRETAVRDGIAIHAEEYYRSLCRIAGLPHNTGNIRVSVYTAFFEDTPLAAIITFFSLHEAVYLYGASSNEHRNLMPAYLLQWQAIQDAQEYGCRSYDFYGIPPSDDPSHPMHGLYRFKTGFGGMIVHRVGTIDIPVKPFRYCLYSAAERLRAFWFKTVKKKCRPLLRGRHSSLKG